jgi:hypothetical protein
MTRAGQGGMSAIGEPKHRAARRGFLVNGQGFMMIRACAAFFVLSWMSNDGQSARPLLFAPQLAMIMARQGRARQGEAYRSGRVGAGDLGLLGCGRLG